MTSVLRFFMKSATLTVFLLLFFLIGNLNGISQTSTSFKEMAKNKAPNYYIINRVVKNNDLLLRNYYSPKQWKTGNVENAWKKVRSYFPKKFYYNSSTKYFMTHQFTEGGLAKLTVYQSKEINKAARNIKSK